MNQMQAFLEKAKEDKDLMAKLNALGAAGTDVRKIVALAAEHDFSITVEEYQMASKLAAARKSAELAEEELDTVTGGLWKDDRHDPEVCGQYNDTHYWCVGFLGLFHCCWYHEIIKNDYGAWSRQCRKGHFHNRGQH